MLRQDLMTHCPRWESCSAPVCPLDPIWRQVPHLRGDRVCAYLTERAKPGGEARLRSILSSDLAEKVSEAYRELSTADCHDGMHVERGRGYIRAVLSRAATTGSRIESGRRLRGASRQSAEAER